MRLLSLSIYFFHSYLQILRTTHNIFLKFSATTYFIQSVSIGVDGSPTVELGLILINGCVHFFAPFNMAEGNTRWRYATAYVVEILEAIVSIS